MTKGFGGFMRRSIAIVASILCFSFGALGQGTSQTIQVGYAVITPAVPGTTGLIASETLIQTRAQDVFQVGVFPPNLATNVLLPVQISTSLAKTLGVAIANPNNIAANITLTLRRSDGTQFTATTISVLARQQIAKLLTEIFPPPPPGGFTTQVAIPAEFIGTLVITSSSPVSILGLNFRGPNYSTILVTDLAPAINLMPVIVPNVGGAGAVLFPQFVTGGGWSTEIAITNTSSTAMTVRLDVFTQAGGPLSPTLNGQTSSSFTNLVIPANGILIMAP
jgi:hypothetical protein